MEEKSQKPTKHYECRLKLITLLWHHNNADTCITFMILLQAAAVTK